MRANQWRILLVAGGVLVVLIVLIVSILRFIGGRYQSRIEDIKIPLRKDTVFEVKRRVVRQVVIRSQGETGCIEVNPDGAVRVYSDCETKKLAATERELDTKFIRQLFEHYAQSERDEEKVVRTSGYVVRVTTDSGVVTYYVPFASDDGIESSVGLLDTISEIIEKIIEDAPEPTPTTVYVSPTVPVVTPTSQLAPSPTSGVVSSPTPTPTAAPKPFSCEFSENDPKKPYRVSQVVCTSEPTPMP